MADAYLKANTLHRTGGARLLFRAVLLLLAISACYAGYLLAPGIALAPTGALMGTLLAMAGMMVMHDASHCTFHRNRHINMAFYMLSTHLAGISRPIWTRQHVVAHHGHTNVLGKDKDLEASGLLRLHPKAPYHPWHRWQPYVYPLLYALVVAKWIWGSDLLDILFNTYRMSPGQRMKAAVDLISTRLVHIGLFLVLPWILRGPIALLGYIPLIMAAGAVLVFVFQPAHVTPLQTFYTPKDEDTLGFEEQQIRTSANFGLGNPLLSWLTGALNQQIEHHLFPHIAHIHYPALAPLVKAMCAEKGLPYHAYPSFTAALKAHHRQMVALSRP